MTEKAGTKRTTNAELQGAIQRFADRIEASNATLAEVLQRSLKFLQDVLKDDQRNRRFWRWVLIFGMVLNFGLLGALGYNAIEGARARAKLVDRSAEQGELLKNVNRTLALLEEATGPEARARAAQSLTDAFVSIDCNNQRAIQRAIKQLGHDYALTEACS